MFCIHRKQKTQQKKRRPTALLLALCLVAGMVLPLQAAENGTYWTVSIDGQPVLQVDSREKAQALEADLKLAYADSLETQQSADIRNHFAFAESDGRTATGTPYFATEKDALTYLLEQNEQAEEPLVEVSSRQTVEKKEKIAFRTQILKDDTIPLGKTRVTTEGKNGRQEVVKEESLVNGKVVESRVLSTNVLETPVTEVVLEGSKGDTPQARAGLRAARSMIGTPYAWGGASLSGTDCSGVVNYCYGGARGRTTYAMIASLQASGDWKTSMDELAPGDLVFPSSGHVGIYVGDGMMIHASSSNGCVVEAPVYAFIGGGSY